MSQVAEKHSFQAEVKQLLDLMIHSLYSHKEVFLRELVSNSSDALDKLRFESLTREGLLPERELSITLRLDGKARTLSVEDNGVGMSREEVLQNIGTIARSGSREFLQLVAKAKKKDGSVPPELIGQFGVGFYASFMVADRVELLTRRAGEDEATLWQSTGDGTFTVEKGQRSEAGTTVTLHLRAEDEDDGLHDYCDAQVLRSVVKKYSDFVAYPIRVQGTDDKGGDIGQDEPLNSGKAIWTRPKEEVTEDDLKEFYRHVSHDWSDYLTHLHVHVEGAFEARALLFLPSKAPFDLYMPDRAHRGLQLYVKRVFILDDCEDLLPQWLRFVRGVVDSEDLSLNVSREMLQQDRQIRAIRKVLVKKLLDKLGSMKDEDREQYLAFWKELGPVLKEGFLDPAADHDRLLTLLVGSSTRSEGAEPTSLAEYLDRIEPGQEDIYYLTAENLAAGLHSPHLEAFRQKGIEVLLFTDRVDEVWLSRGGFEFQERKLVSVTRGEVSLGTDEEKKKRKEEVDKSQTEYGDLFFRLRAILQDEIKEVRLSSRLTESPACLVGEEGEISPQLEAMLRQMGQEVPETKRVLELNPEHPLLPRLKQLYDKDAHSEELEESAWLLVDQAVLAEGGKLKDPARLARRISELMKRSL